MQQRTHAIAAWLIMSVLTMATARADMRSDWNQPQAPFRIHGDTWYVGVRGLSAILITSKDGHVLIDGALPESAPEIVANIASLRFRIEDVKLILNTHAHFDHAGGIAELQRLSGAQVAASMLSAPVLRSGASGPDDPQYGRLPPIAAVADVTTFNDGETLRVGTLAATAHLTPGHTPGGTSWTWRSCEKAHCVDIVYADSLYPLAAPGFLYTSPTQSPNGVQQLERSYAVLDALPCDILITPHPEVSDLFGRLARRESDAAGNAFIDPNACRHYVQGGRELLREKIAQETKK